MWVAAVCRQEGGRVGHERLSSEGAAGLRGAQAQEWRLSQGWGWGCSGDGKLGGGGLGVAVTCLGLVWTVGDRGKAGENA